MTSLLYLFELDKSQFALFFLDRMASSSDPQLHSSGRPRSRLQWKDCDMVTAMEAVSNGKMSVAANSFGVPRKTLDDRCHRIFGFPTLLHPRA